MKKGSNKILTLACIITMVLLLIPGMLFAGGDKEEAPEAEGAEKTIKAGFVYVGPIGDYGFSHAHDVGRRYVDDKYDWLETMYVESVPEADASRIIDRLVQEENCDVVFTCSFGYMDDTVAAGKRYPDSKFMHCSGFKRSDNVGTYFIDFYQLYYLNGLMAGALTESNKAGYVGAFPIPEVVRHLDAFALGIKEVNPEATMSVRWINSWVGPAQAREAAEAMIADGVDVLAFTEDTPAVVEVGQEHMEAGDRVYTFSHYSPMQSYGKDSVASGQLVDWGIQYEKILTDIYEGTWSGYDLLWMVEEDGAILGGSFDEPINEKFVDDLKAVMIDHEEFGKISVYDLVMKRYDQFKEDNFAFNPFSGPLYDNKGNLKIPEGESADVGQLLSIMYYVDNIAGDLPQ